MSATHLHLVLNHVCVLGNVFGLVLLAYACWRKDEGLKKGSLGAFLIAAGVAVVVYLTGPPATKAIQELPEVSRLLVGRHEEVALFALVLLLGLGVVSLAGLLRYRRGRAIPAWFSVGLLALSLVSAVVVSWTANLGGQIRHPEIRSAG